MRRSTGPARVIAALSLVTVGIQPRAGTASRRVCPAGRRIAGALEVARRAGAAAGRHGTNRSSAAENSAKLRAALADVPACGFRTTRPRVCQQGAAHEGRLDADRTRRSRRGAGHRLADDLRSARARRPMRSSSRSSCPAAGSGPIPPPAPRPSISRASCRRSASWSITRPPHPPACWAIGWPPSCCVNRRPTKPC